MKALREGTPASKLAGLASADLADRATRAGSYAEAIKHFLEKQK